MPAGSRLDRGRVLRIPRRAAQTAGVKSAFPSATGTPRCVSCASRRASPELSLTLARKSARLPRLAEPASARTEGRARSNSSRGPGHAEQVGGARRLQGSGERHLPVVTAVEGLARPVCRPAVQVGRRAGPGRRGHLLGHGPVGRVAVAHLHGARGKRPVRLDAPDERDMTPLDQRAVRRRDEHDSRHGALLRPRTGAGRHEPGGCERKEGKRDDAGGAAHIRTRSVPDEFVGIPGTS